MSLRRKNRYISIEAPWFFRGAFFLGVFMETINECARLYKTLLNKKYIFTIEHNIRFLLEFKPDNFFHLIGLEKLTDLSILQDKSPKKVFKDLCNDRILHHDIQKSNHYSKIEDRVNNFYLIKSLLNFDESNKIIIDFDKSKLDFKTKLENTKYILYRRENPFIVHLTIGSKESLYPETYIVEKTNIYLSEQTMLDILNIEIADKN